MPEFAAITTYPRYGTIAESGTRSRAAAPEQFTTTGARRPAPPGTDRRHLEPAAGLLEPGARVLQVHRHSGERGGVVQP